MTHNAYQHTHDLISALQARGLHAALVGMGGNCEAVEVRTDDNYGADGEDGNPYVLITDGDAGAPFAKKYDYIEDVYYRDRAIVAVAYLDNGSGTIGSPTLNDDFSVIVDCDETTIAHVVLRTVSALI